MRAKELTELAIDWLEKEHSGALIVTELSVATWGGASIDVAAITEDEIIGIEIKGEGDSPSRLPRQELAYGMVANKMWLLPSPSIQAKIYNHLPKSWGRLEIFDGEVRPFNRYTTLGEKIELEDGGYRHKLERSEEDYLPDRAYAIELTCPYACCGTLWRDELYILANRCGLNPAKRATVTALTKMVCETLPAPLVQREMVKQLREREWKKPIRKAA